MSILGGHRPGRIPLGEQVHAVGVPREVGQAAGVLHGEAPEAGVVVEVVPDVRRVVDGLDEVGVIPLEVRRPRRLLDAEAVAPAVIGEVVPGVRRELMDERQLVSIVVGVVCRSPGLEGQGYHLLIRSADSRCVGLVKWSRTWGV